MAENRSFEGKCEVSRTISSCKRVYLFYDLAINFRFSREAAFEISFLLSLSLESTKRVHFSSTWSNKDDEGKLLSWPYPLALFLFDGNNRRTNIDVNVAESVIIVR